MAPKMPLPEQMLNYFLQGAITENSYESGIFEEAPANENLNFK